MDITEYHKSIIETVANDLFERLSERIENWNRDVWLTQQELMEQEGISWQEVKRMESYGLKSLRQGKYKKYCLADVNEIKHLMKG